MSVNRGSHFQVHFVWQVWDGQLSPAFKSIRLQAFGGWKVDRGTTQLHARILRGKGVQKKKPNKFTVGSSTSATFVLPVRHGTGVALQRKRMDVSQNPQSTTGTLARGCSTTFADYLPAGFDVAFGDPLGCILCVCRFQQILDSGLVCQLANPRPVLQCILEI